MNKGFVKQKPSRNLSQQRGHFLSLFCSEVGRINLQRCGSGLIRSESKTNSNTLLELPHCFRNEQLFIACTRIHASLQSEFQAKIQDIIAVGGGGRSNKGFSRIAAGKSCDEFENSHFQTGIVALLDSPLAGSKFCPMTEQHEESLLRPVINCSQTHQLYAQLLLLLFFWFLSWFSQAKRRNLSNETQLLKSTKTFSGLAHCTEIFVGHFSQNYCTTCWFHLPLHLQLEGMSLRISHQMHRDAIGFFLASMKTTTESNVDLWPDLFHCDSFVRSFVSVQENVNVANVFVCQPDLTNSLLQVGERITDQFSTCADKGFDWRHTDSGPQYASATWTVRNNSVPQV